MNTLDKNNSVLVIIDIQERLVSALNKDIIVKKASILAQAAKILEIPIVITEQYPKGLGSTLDVLKEKLPKDTPIIKKTAFSAFLEPEFKEKLSSLNKKQIVICGVETHVCVHQSVSDLLEADYEVFVVKDACASRDKYEFQMGIDRMQSNGAKISCVEIVLFEWLKTSKDPNFKEIQGLIK